MAVIIVFNSLGSRAAKSYTSSMAMIIVFISLGSRAAKSYTSSMAMITVLISLGSRAAKRNDFLRIAVSRPLASSDFSITGAT